MCASKRLQANNNPKNKNEHGYWIINLFLRTSFYFNHIGISQGYKFDNIYYMNMLNNFKRKKKNYCSLKIFT